MGGKNKKATVGYWYHPAFHMGISLGPIDALLEIRGGDITAWSGQLTASGTVTINQPNLWGGEKDQGGIVGDFDVMFGEPTQQPNAYLIATFGNQQPAWRGLTTIVFKGGRYGAMSPYAQKISYKGLKITHGWDGDPGDGSACWYPAKAVVQVGSGTVYNAELDIAGTAAQPSLVTPNYTLSGMQPTDAVYIEHVPGMTYQGWSHWGSDTDPQVTPPGKPWGTEFTVTNGSGTSATYWTEKFANAAEAEAYANSNPILLYGATEYQFWLQDSPVNDNRGGLSIRVRGGDPPMLAMNPAHVLYYARTQQHMGREPIANIDDASHRAGADWFFSQGFGICWDYDPSQESIDAFIARIEKVSGCSQSRSPVDGKWYLDVANGVYDLASLPILTDDDILDFQRQPTTLDNAVNSVSVQFFDPHLKADVTTPPVQALALVNAFGTIHQDVTYKEIPTSGLAARVAQRDLQGFMTPVNGFEITTSRKPYAWRRGTYFRLQSVKRGIADMVCILGDIDIGTLKSGAIKITATQDIYSLPAASFVLQESGVDTRPSIIPAAIANQAAFETPYIELVRSLSASDLAALANDVGYLSTVAVDPSVSRDYAITVSTDGGATYAGANTAEWCPSALIVEGDTLSGAIPRTSFTLVGGTLLASVVVGQAALWGTEIVRVDAVDAVAGTLTLGRGCADTVPAAHAANSRVWFFDGFEGTDGIQYTAGEAVDVELLTNTGSQQLAPSLATPIPLTFAGRAALPYPPGKLLIGGNPYPTTVSGAFTVAWNHRNRVTQADQLVDASMASVMPADNTRYHLRFVDASNTLLAERTDIGPGTASVTLNYTGNVTMTLATIDDNGVSAQAHTVTFVYTPPGGSPTNTITATAYTPVYTGIIYDGGNAATGT